MEVVFIHPLFTILKNSHSHHSTSTTGFYYTKENLEKKKKKPREDEKLLYYNLHTDTHEAPVFSVRVKKRGEYVL